MRPAALCLIGLVLSVTGGVPAAAWAPETRVAMVDEAIRLMPESLRLALGVYRREVLRGMLEPLTAEDGAEHRPPWNRGGTLDGRVAAEVDELVAAMGAGARFPEVARRLGRLAHFVADCGFPPGVSDAGGGARYAHFSRFCESRRAKFPLVFYGHDDDALARGDLRRFALNIMERGRDEDRELARAYAAAGEPPDPAAFDDRSVPFAIGSLSYSRSVTEIVRAWLAAWQSGGGDMGRTPYLNGRRP